MVLLSWKIVEHILQEKFVEKVVMAHKKEPPIWEELRKEVPPKTFVESAECD